MRRRKRRFFLKLQAALVCTKNFFMFIATEFSKLSIKRYKPVGGVWWGTQIDNLNFKLPFTQKKNFKFFFQIRIFREKFCSECLLSCVDKIISLKDDFTPGYDPSNKCYFKPP
jgi:hypothetical protein